MHIHHPGAGLVRAQHYFIELWLPIFCLSHRVGRHNAQISSFLQSLDGLRSRLLIERVVIDSLAHHLQILLQGSLTGANYRAVIAPRRDPDQNEDDCNYNHQFDQRKAKAANAALRTGNRVHLLAHFQSTHTRDHQSEYFVPSCAIPCDFEYTSKTFFPPQLVESGSSCTARKTHSFCPVIGSTGILRRKRIFLSLEAPSCTPFTSVSKSGG